MEKHGHYIPDHAVPVQLSLVANSKQQTIKFGKVELVRVQVMGIVESIELNECDMDFVITDEKKENRVNVQKILTSSFPRELAQQLSVGNLVEIYGKVRVLEDGGTFLNALAIHIVTEPQFEAFETMCRFSEMFYEKNIPCLPPGTSTNAPLKYGLRQKLGNLDRFPMEMLEESSSNENNMGDWPVEIEYLAAGISLDGRTEREKERVSIEDQKHIREGEQDVFNNDVNMDEEEDSFDAGPMKAAELHRKEQNDAHVPIVTKKDDQVFDSFEEGPIKKDAPDKDKEAEEIEYDSFENI
uniref:Tudor domain-containing protein n=1 Tax=Caenorhabditis tropicalis TaxID=1561998 RepID=A0A1I7T7R4_9PELO